VCVARYVRPLPVSDAALPPTDTVVPRPALSQP